MTEAPNKVRQSLLSRGYFHAPVRHAAAIGYNCVGTSVLATRSAEMVLTRSAQELDLRGASVTPSVVSFRVLH